MHYDPQRLTCWWQTLTYQVVPRNPPEVSPKNGDFRLHFSSSNYMNMILIHNNSGLKSNQPTKTKQQLPCTLRRIMCCFYFFLGCCSPRGIPPMVTPLVLLPILPLPVGSMPWLLWNSLDAFLAVEGWPLRSSYKAIVWQHNCPWKKATKQVIFMAIIEDIHKYIQ